ncbi:hypothetical protein FIBSPDRAFT_925458 [Athelia psychrophila]|uniref:G domain-containing protein n=1 Tax=Athelia psychrophila TaxID=1759441 RepID=A0A166UUT5_9AGAM|nr:hypothetical protein FIBSPDRAFT_925458 [Fibularhizoctonia sp. CBS 109695]
MVRSLAYLPRSWLILTSKAANHQNIRNNPNEQLVQTMTGMTRISYIQQNPLTKTPGHHTDFSESDYDGGSTNETVDIRSRTFISKISDIIARGLNQKRRSLVNVSTNNSSRITMLTPFKVTATCETDPKAQASGRINVVVFGEAGAGKSSLVNLMAGRDAAQVSSSVNGCTFESTGYDIDIPEGPAVRIWDTAGLEEGAAGTVDTAEAISNIYKLTRNLEDGISLLVYCVRGRITNSTVRNYKMFKGFCDGKVPIALVVTALEYERNKDAWWTKNVQRYLRAGVDVDDHACITTLKVSEWAEDYDSSTAAVCAMLNRAYLRTPWKMERKDWVKRCISKFQTSTGWVIGMRLFHGAGEGRSHLLRTVL